MTIVPDNSNGLSSAHQMQKYDSIADELSDKMLKRFTGNVASGKEDILRDLLLRADSVLQQRLEEKIGKIDNPFVKSIANTSLNYSKQQAHWFFMAQINKYNGFI